MLFNSFEFFLFLTVAFVLYWIAQKRLKAQNALLLVMSYVFYGWWDWRFLSLIFLSTVVDFIAGQQIAKSDQQGARKRWLALSMLFNLGMLAYFKYANFFIDSFMDLAAGFIDADAQFSTLNVILPVGISFYTFQTMSYTIDIYRKELKPTRNFIDFAAFVSFFPQLVAGPIERAARLLPQIAKPRTFRYEDGVKGMRLILYGLAKKVLIADQVAPVVNDIFLHYDTSSGSTLWLGAILFSIQIYCDFSGYSDIAIGIAKLLGIELMSNFRFPYFSKNIAEFWKRWHISLSTWFRDYLFIPLGGSRGSTYFVSRNIFIVFATSGLWHGANWTFVAWGVLHALFYEVRRIFQWITGGREFPILPMISAGLSILITYLGVTFAWVFFRAADIQEAFVYCAHMITKLLTAPGQFMLHADMALGLWLAAFIVFEIMNRKDERNPLGWIPNRWLRQATYVLIFFFILNAMLTPGSANEFIYFQF